MMVATLLLKTVEINFKRELAWKRQGFFHFIVFETMALNLTFN